MSKPKMMINSTFKPLLKKAWLVLATIVVVLAVTFTVFRALTPLAKHYHATIEQELSSLLHRPVHIKSVETNWYWFLPVIQLNDVTVELPTHPLQIHRVMVGVSLLSSLWNFELKPGLLYIDGVQTTIKQDPQGWQVEGILSTSPADDLSRGDYLQGVRLLDSLPKIVLKNIGLRVYLNNGRLIPVESLHLIIENSFGHFRFKGRATLGQTVPTVVSILGNMRLDESDLSATSGQLYVSVHHILPLQWQDLYPTAYRFENGLGDVDLWLDMENNHIESIQADIAFKHLAWRHESDPNLHFIQTLKANMALVPNNPGWKFTADHVYLTTNGVNWPENRMEIQFSNEQIMAYCKTILIQPLLTMGLPLPHTLLPISEKNPVGTLENTQLTLKQGELISFLSRFKEVGWKKKDRIPGVANLSGAIRWRPLTGRLDLDAKDVTLKLPDRPKLLLSILNTSIDWQRGADDFIHLPRFIAKSEGLLIEARGALSGVSSPNPALNLQLNYQGNGLEKWKPFLPKQGMKPKLYAWLTEEVETVGQAKGQLQIEGPLHQFPFDHGEGKFLMNNELKGVALRFNKHWPLSQNIDAYLQVDKRLLTAEVLHANLNQIETKAVKLSVGDLGLDKETLLVHGIVKAPASQMMEYVLHSPLQNHLSRLKALQFTGDLSLDLNLEVPLYPENDDILVLGTLDFDNNNLTVKHALHEIAVRKLNGQLVFDKEGVDHSDLTGLLFNIPVTIKAHGVTKPNPATEIDIAGELNMKALPLALPQFLGVEGACSVLARLRLNANPNESDSLKLQSNLNGLAIALPAPMGKTKEQSIPLTLEWLLHPKAPLELRFNYQNRLRGEVVLGSKEEGFGIKKSWLVLGSSKKNGTLEPGLNISGGLPSLDLAPWQKWYAPIALTGKNTSVLHSLNLSFEKLHVFKQTIQQLQFKVTREPSSWRIFVKQPYIEGNIEYFTSENKVVAHLDYVHLPKTLLNSNKENNFLNTITPADFPHLSVQIDDLRLYDIDLGQLTWQSKTQGGNLDIQQCNLTTNDYQLTCQGSWEKSANRNRTQVQASLAIQDLSSLLQRFDITPAVVSKKGTIEFKGEWPKPFYDFSLNQSTGKVSIYLKKGRITNLSKETEEKLGLGKLLSVLSLQTIPRRLVLDFSDLSSGGYSFDEFKGSFVLKKGVLSTTDSYIDGPVAYASMQGDLDLVHQLYNLELKVAPHITASLPIVATIAGGPVAGIATWVASKLINQGVEKISNYTYRITGPWKQPLVEQVSITKKPKPEEAP